MRISNKWHQYCTHAFTIFYGKTKMQQLENIEIEAPHYARTNIIYGLVILSFIFAGTCLAVWLRDSSMPVINLLKRAVILMLTFSGIGLLFWIMERLWPEAKASEPRNIEDTHLNLLYFILNISVIARVTVSILIVWFMAVAIIHMPRLPRTWITCQPIWAQTLELAIVKDFIGYWTHRMFHQVPFLWRFHAIHHSSKDVYWLSAFREHPIEHIIGKIFTLTPLYILGFNPEIMGGYVAVWTVYTLYLHANFKCSYGPFRYFITSPAFHRWHHSTEEPAINRNYSSLLPVWDILFGTIYFPYGRHSATYGLSGEELSSNIVEHITYPIKTNRN